MEPLSLYKYIPFNAPSKSGEDTLQSKRQRCFENGEIWYSEANKLNDPFDCQPFFELPVGDGEKLEDLVNSLSPGELGIVESRIGVSTKEELLALLKTPNVFTCQGLSSRKTITPDFSHQAIFIGCVSGYFGGAISKVGVLSLTEDPFSLMMWAHYGGNGTGICVEFERNASNTLGSANTRKVEYVSKRPKIKLRDRHSKIVEILHTKSHIWEYEKEWRHCEGEGEKAYTFPGEVKKIIFGLKCHDDTVELTKKIFGTNVNYEQVMLSSDYSLSSDCGIKDAFSRVPLKWT